MKLHVLFASLMFAALAVQPVLADDAHHPDQKTGVGAPSADQTIQKMQTNAKRMQSQLEKMAKSKNAQERQQLMQEYMKTMQESTAMAQGMMGADCPMMGKGGMGMMGQGGMGPEATMERMQMMEKRMDMMQMMMEQMPRQPTPMPAK